MALHRRLFVLSIMSTALLQGCECDDCNRVLPVAFVRVRTSTSSGPLGDVHLLFERQAFTPVTATTDSDGRYTFDALEAIDGEVVTVSVAPPVEYAEPAPRQVSLVVGDTIDVEVVLEPAP